MEKPRIIFQVLVHNITLDGFFPLYNGASMEYFPAIITVIS
jgi:hypothetical protein